MARDKPGAEAAYLRSLGPVEGARVMGSRERLQRVLNGASVDDVVNATKDPYYKLERLGAIVENRTDSKNSKLPLPDIQDAMNEYKNATNNRISPVSNAMLFPKTAQYDQVRKALSAIDSVHDDGRLPKTAVILTQSSIDLGEYFPRLNRLSLQPGQHEVGTVFHEVAHMLDYHAFGSGHGYETVIPSGRLNAFVSVALKSDAAQEWYSVKVNTSREYLLDPAEIWARAYTQWIATKTTTHVNFNAEIGYWTESDFVPIVNEIENAFRLEGWL